MNKVIIWALLLFIVGCSPESRVDPAREVIEIELSSGEELRNDIFPESFISQRDYIVLETSEESLISNIGKIKIDGERIYLLDDVQQILLIFNIDGTYLGKIGNRGRGPGEYVDLYDFDLDENHVYLSANIPSGILRYNKSNGLFDKRIAPETNAFRIAVTDKYIFSYSGNNNYRTFKDITLTDKITEKIEKEYKTIDKESAGTTYTRTIFSKNKENVYAFFPHDYNIYEFGDDGYFPVYRVDFGDGNMLPEDAASFSDEKLEDYLDGLPDKYDIPIRGIDELFVTNKYICFTFVYYKMTYLCFYNRETQKVVRGIIMGSIDKNLTGKFLYADDGLIITSAQPSSIIEAGKMISKANDNYRLPEKLRNIRYEDNPVLILYKIDGDE